MNPTGSSDRSPAPRRPGSLLPDSNAGKDTALYIAQMTAQLARLARGRRLDVLAYVLDMAEVEARAAAISRDGPD